MKLSRTIIFPLLLALVLLFAQQAGAAHSLHHALENLTHQQDDKQSPHSDACEKCADYAQLSNVLNVSAYDFTLQVFSDATIQYRTISSRFITLLAASARGPPGYLQIIA